jgi:hypothetical protein
MYIVTLENDELTGAYVTEVLTTTVSDNPQDFSSGP